MNSIAFTEGSYESGSILRILVQWIKDNPEYLTNYVEDLFVTDYQKMKAAATEREEATYFVLGLRSTGSRLFEVGEEPGEGNTMSGAVLRREELNQRHQWFLLEIPPEADCYQGSAVNGKIKPLSDHEEARSVLQLFSKKAVA